MTSSPSPLNASFPNYMWVNSTVSRVSIVAFREKKSKIEIESDVVVRNEGKANILNAPKVLNSVPILHGHKNFGKMPLLWRLSTLPSPQT